MRSLRARLFLLWLMLVASAVATGFLLVASFRQSAAALVDHAEEQVTRSCRELADRYSFFSAGWDKHNLSSFDEELRNQLKTVVQAALARQRGVEGGIWQSRAGALAYAFPTYEGTGPKTDLPAAELPAIREMNAETLHLDQPVTVRRPSQSQVLLLHACPLPGPIEGLTGWTMTRAFTGSGEGFNRLLAGLGVLALTVLGSAAWLGRVLYTWSGRIARLETTLGQHDVANLPRLEPTGERELDRLVEALNAAGTRLAEARDRTAAAERLAAVGRLAAGLAHEIRNPIAAMRLKAENALASLDGSRREAALRTVLDQIGRLDALLRDLLATTHRREPVAQDVELGPFLASCAEAHRELARAKGVAIEVEPLAAGIDGASFDPEQVRRALDNLILNALEHTPPGGMVRLGVSRQGDRLLLQVADTGSGVDPSVRDRLFEPFATGRAEGTGLGLAIVREIARAHGGEARLLPSNVGALFELELPWRPRPS